MIWGAANAPVTIVEYASLTCPHCAHFHAETLPKLKTEYIDTGKVKLVFRDFPLDGIALAGAMIAACVATGALFRLGRRPFPPAGELDQGHRAGRHGVAAAPWPASAA